MVNLRASVATLSQPSNGLLPRKGHLATLCEFPVTFMPDLFPKEKKSMNFLHFLQLSHLILKPHLFSLFTS